MKYTVEIYGNGIELGVGELSNEQYKFWSKSENKKHFHDAVRLDLDDSDLKVPAKAKFKKDFLDMTEYGAVTGMPFLDDEGPFIEIVTSTGKEFFKGTYSEYIEKYDPEYNDLLVSEVQKDHIDYPDDADYVMFWRRYLKGTFFKAEIEANKFDPTKLKFSQIEVLGGLDLLVYVEYDGVEVEPNEYSIRETSTIVEMTSC
jgi:hypothetical protein